MSKVSKKNASLAFVLLLSIPVCASQHSTAESLKKVSQSNAIAAAFGAILAKSGVKTAGQNAFAWASRTLPSWQTIRQAPRAGLALVQRGTTAVIHAGKHASSCLVPYVRPAINFTRSHPRMTQAAFGSLFATGLAYAIYKTVKYWKAHHPAAPALRAPVNPAAQEAAGLGLDAKLPRRATRPHGAFRVPSEYQHQEPATAAAATPALEQQPQQMKKEKQHEREEVVMPLAAATATTAVTAPSLEDARQHINQLEEEIRLLKAVKAKMATQHSQFTNIEKAAGAFINTSTKENATEQEIKAASENYFKIYTNAFDYSIGAVPERLTELAQRYNDICAKILVICADPMNFNDKEKFAEITRLWNVVKKEIAPQINTEIQNLVEEKTAIEISLGR
jgi:hypothetical protein